MSGSLELPKALLQPRSVLMSMAHVSTKGHADICFVLKSEAMLMSVGSVAARGHIDVGGLCCLLRPW